MKLEKYKQDAQAYEKELNELHKSIEMMQSVEELEAIPSSNTMQIEFNSLQEEYQKVRKNYEDIYKKYHELEKQRIDLKGKSQTLKIERNSILKEYQNMELLQKGLEETIERLEKEKNGAIEQYNLLEQQHIILEESNKKLQEAYKEQGTAKGNLEEEYNDLVTERNIWRDKLEVIRKKYGTQRVVTEVLKELETFGS